MAAEYYVRIRGKEHGPFTGSQLKKLADKGQVTEQDEIRPAEGGEWYPATKVAGLFDGAKAAEPSGNTQPTAAAASSKPATGSKSSTAGRGSAASVSADTGKPPKTKPAAGSGSASTGSASSGSSSPRGTKAAAARPKPAAKPKPKPKPKPKRKPAVDPSDVFDLDDEDEDVEFTDDDDELFDDEDDFEDDDRPARRPSRGRGRSRNRRRGGTGWGQVRTGLLLLAIAVCVYTGAYAMQALAEVIGYISLVSALGGSRPPSSSTGEFLAMLGKGAIFLALLANVAAIVGGSLSIFAPADKGAKGLAIAVVATLAIHLVTHFIFVFQPVFDRGPMGFGRGLSIGGDDAELVFGVTWVPYYAGLILVSVFLWAVAQLKKEFHHGQDCLNNIWMIGIYVGLMILGYMVGKLDMIPQPKSAGTAKAMLWLFVLLRLGHLSLLGIYLGRLIGQTFFAKSSV